MKSILRAFAASVCLLSAVVADADPTASQVDGPTDSTIVSRWKAHVLPPERLTKHSDGEDIAWLAVPYLMGRVRMAQALDGDTECLDAFCDGIDYLISIASRDIDGLYGWPTEKGNYGKQGPRCILLDDARIVEPIARFARLVHADLNLVERYGTRADRYLAFAEDEILPKWRDSWLEFEGSTWTLGRAPEGWVRERAVFPEPAGVYRFYGPGKTPGTSLPLNQLLSAAQTFLVLHDATGKTGHLGTARRIAATAKHLYLAHNAARTGGQEERFDPWCYWQPAWEGDFAGETKAAGWVGPHPRRSSYYAVEVSVIAELFRREIVFTQDDIHRLARLNLDLMWNGDTAAPAFDYVYAHRGKTYPGQLWHALAEFDDTILKLSAPHRDRETIERIAGRWRGISAVPGYLLSQRKGVIH